MRKPPSQKTLLSASAPLRLLQKNVLGTKETTLQSTKKPLLIQQKPLRYTYLSGLSDTSYLLRSAWCAGRTHPITHR